MVRYAATARFVIAVDGDWSIRRRKAIDQDRNTGDADE